MARLIALLGLMLVCAMPARASDALSVHDLKQHWQAYNGKTVEVRGQIDACEAECLLCPEELTALADFDPCITIAFGKQRDPAFYNSGYRAETLQRAFYRFAVVTVRARLDATCMIGDDGNFVGDVVCTDSDANLDDAHVIDLSARKTSADGLVEQRRLRAVTRPEASELPALEAEFRLTLGEWARLPHTFLAVTPSDADRASKKSGDNFVVDALGCVCMEDSCEGRWPARYFEDFGAPTDPFRCWEMQKHPEGWRVLPAF